MSKKLSIILPIYNPRQAQLTRALASINNQIGVDFSQIDVHLVNDAGAAIDGSKLAIFERLDLRLHDLEVNGGIGPARQYGIDHSEGDYVMFMDQDDVLHNAEALHHFFEVVELTGHHQLIIAQVLQEFMAADGRLLLRNIDTRNWVLVHGKFFQREYLNAMALRFHPTLRRLEDHYFVQLACTLAADIYPLEQLVYAWLWNGSSQTRRPGGNRAYILAIPEEAQLYLDFIKERRPDILAREFDATLANSLHAYRTNLLPAVEDQEKFQKDFMKILSRFPEEFDGYPARLLTGQGHYYDFLRAPENQEYLQKAKEDLLA